MMRSSSDLPVYLLDRDGVRAVDREAVAAYGLPGIVLMENACRALAAEALDMLAEAGASGGTTLIVCGRGNNGGDGWALARHLANAGTRPIVAPLGDPRSDSDAGINCAVCRRMGIEERAVTEDDLFEGVHLVVDALFGTGLDRPIDGAAAEVITRINACGRPVLAVDVPSGLDCDTGGSLGVTVRATRTVTFVGTKPGLTSDPGKTYAGEVVIGDIGAPRVLTERFGRPLTP